MKKCISIILFLLFAKVSVFSQDSFTREQKVFKSVIKLVFTHNEVFQYAKKYEAKFFESKNGYEGKNLYINTDGTFLDNYKAFEEKFNENVFYFYHAKDYFFFDVKFLMNVDDYKVVGDNIYIKFHFIDSEREVLGGKHTKLVGKYKLSNDGVRLNVVKSKVRLKR